MKDETHENIDDEFDEDDLYELEKWVLMKNNDVSVCLKANQNTYDIKIPNVMNCIHDN